MFVAFLFKNLAIEFCEHEIPYKIKIVYYVYSADMFSHFYISINLFIYL
jgi:hypothetical protein